MIKLALMENTDKCSLHWIKYFYLDILNKKIVFREASIFGVHCIVQSTIEHSAKGQYSRNAFRQLIQNVIECFLFFLATAVKTLKVLGILVRSPRARLHCALYPFPAAQINILKFIHKQFLDVVSPPRGYCLPDVLPICMTMHVS